MVGMVDSFTTHDRPSPPITRPRQDDLPEIEIPPPPGASAGAAEASFKLPPRPQQPAHTLMLPRRRQGLHAKVLLFAVIGFGIGLLVGIAFLLG